MQPVMRQQLPPACSCLQALCHPAAAQISACDMQKPDVEQQVENKLHELGKLLCIRQDAVQVSCHLPPTLTCLCTVSREQLLAVI